MKNALSEILTVATLIISDENERFDGGPFQMLRVLAAGFFSLPVLAMAGSYPTNLMIGTGGGMSSPGNLFPGAARAFGMVRLSPDTGALLGTGVRAVDNNIGTAGFYDQHTGILGFSHTRLSGTGVREGGAFRVRPVVQGVGSGASVLRMDHSRQKMQPGFYEIDFPQNGLRAELTATAHCGVHRYSLDPVSASANSSFEFIVDLRSALFQREKTRVDVELLNSGFAAMSEQKGAFSERYGGYPLYAYAQWSIPADQRLVQSPVQEEIHIEFSNSVRDVELRLCLSAVSIEGAKANFKAEVDGKSFGALKASAIADWQQWLGRGHAVIRDPKFATQYYTALYHSMLMPTTWTDSDGKYVGFDRKIHQADDFTYRTDLSLWDTFRNVHPLYTLIAPEIACDSVKSLLAMADQSGMLPRWPSGGGESSSMFGSPANFVLSEAYFKKTCAFDAHKALAYMVRSANQPVVMPSSRDFICYSLGYCPSDKVDVAVSKTLEYAWADAMTGLLAKEIGANEIAQEFTARGRAYQTTWDPAQKYFAPKDSAGKFAKVVPNLLPYIDLFKQAQAFAEGSANQWRYSVPHEPQSLIQMMGGNQAFVQELESFMANHSNTRSDLIPKGGYWHGNEHNLHAPYLFTEAGRADLTQKWVRWILTDRYANENDGLGGNDDGGALSAWLVISSVGLYPQAGTDRYWIGAPIVDSANWNLGAGARLKITAHAQSAENLYVEKVLLNGRRLCQPVVTHAELKNADLEFFMSPLPAKAGGFDCN